jgi:hypothetical protein
VRSSFFLLSGDEGNLAHHHASNGRPPHHHAGPRRAPPLPCAQTFHLPLCCLIKLYPHSQLQEQEAAPEPCRRRRSRRRQGRGVICRERRGGSRGRRRGGNGLLKPAQSLFAHPFSAVARNYFSCGKFQLSSIANCGYLNTQL